MLLFDLCDTPGVSGSEEQVRDLLARSVRAHVDDLQLDSIGNLIALRRARVGAANAARVLLTAHMDEPGFIVTHNKDEHLTLASVGNLDVRSALGKRVMVGPERLAGILLAKPVHHTHEERDKMPDLEHLPLEMGGEEGKVKIGQAVAFAGRAELLGEPIQDVQPRLAPESLPDRGRVKARALSSRAGCALLAELLVGELELPFDLWVVFTVQQEVGLRGARVLSHRIDPHLALVLTGLPADDDFAGPDAPQPSSRLGGGVILPRRDQGHVVHSGLHMHLVQACQANQIPWQPFASNRYRSEAAAAARATGGRPAATLGIPVRYPGAALGIMELADYHAAAALLSAGLSDGGLRSYA